MKPKGTQNRRSHRTGIDWGDDHGYALSAEDELLARSASAPRDWRKLIVSVLTPVLLLVAGFGLWLGLKPVPEPQTVTAPPPPDPLQTYSADMTHQLVAPTLTVPARLKLIFAGHPDDLCRELAGLGLPNSGWRRAPFVKGRWQCASDVVPLSTPSVDYGAATLFFLLRGPSDDRVDYLRIKLNVEDPRQMEHGRDMARSVIKALSERYSWAVPDRFFEAVRAFEPLEMTDRGIRLSVAPEDPALTGDPAASQRLNIILDFGDPDLIRSPRGFQR